MGRTSARSASTLALVIVSMSGGAVSAQECAATPWRCAAAPPPSEINGVRTSADFWGAMTFSDAGSDRPGGRTAYAVGTIDSLTPGAFRAFLQSYSIPPGTIIIFHSPGGNPGAGIEIGRIIRSHSLRTSIGQGTRGGVLGSQQPGICASACSLAFLGGVQRSVPERSLYGVHSVYSNAGQPPDALYVGQQIAAELGNYVNEMGVKVAFLTLMTAANGGSREMNYLNRQQLLEVGVVTGFATVWTVAPDSRGFTLVGTNPESVSFPGKHEEMVFWCTGSPRRVLLGGYLIPEEAHELQFGSPMSPERFAASTTKLEVSVFRPGAFRPEDRYVTVGIPASDVYQPTRAADAHRVSAFVALTPRLAELLTDASVLTLGFRQEFALGYSLSVDFSSGRRQALDFIAGCR